MTDEEVMRYRDDLEMMRRPHLWPRMCLPLKRGVRGEEIGVLWCPQVGNRPKYYWLEGQNIEGLPIEHPQWVQGGDELPVRLVHEGWIVD